MSDFTELIPMTKSRKQPKEGDVFVIQPIEGTYYCGKVIIAEIESKNPDFDGWHLIYVYNFSSNEILVPENLDSFDLMFAPPVVNEQGWLRGYFETIASIPVTDKERNLDYGFYIDSEEGPYYDLRGDMLSYKPKFTKMAGLSSYGYVGRRMHQLLGLSNE